ncbi:MAG: SRPBCC family protein [Planctomycetes bacterium]|nr:SRPBCC family protein [Planctomycetota bacterium]
MLKTEIWLPAPRVQVFEFFSDAFQLESITPPLLKFHVVTPRPIVIQAGTIIDYRLRLHGIPLRWRSLIPVWEPYTRFVDEQLKGPYLHWRHEHRFSDRNGGTLVSDEVFYRVLGGSLVNRLFVAPDLRRIFAYRSQKLQEIFGASAKAT